MWITGSASVLLPTSLYTRKYGLAPHRPLYPRARFPGPRGRRGPGPGPGVYPALPIRVYSARGMNSFLQKWCSRAHQTLGAPQKKDSSLFGRTLFSPDSSLFGGRFEFIRRKIRVYSATAPNLRQIRVYSATAPNITPKG